MNNRFTLNDNDDRKGPELNDDLQAALKAEAEMSPTQIKMEAMKAQVERLYQIVFQSDTPEELREALRLMCRSSLQLETGAHHLTKPGEDLEAAGKYLDAVKISIDKAFESKKVKHD